MDQFIINIAKQGDLGIALYTLITIVIASILSGIIGFEREFHGHAAGLRTHILVAIGASIIMTVSIYGFRYTDYSNRDPARLAAQVVSGIGFLGAGTIMQTGTNIKGLTTAATVWFCGGIGLACSPIVCNCYFGTLLVRKNKQICLFAVYNFLKICSF